MKKVLVFIQIGLALTAWAVPSWAEWSPVSKTLGEPSLRLVTAHPQNTEILFAATDRRLYKTADGGASWKRVLSLRGDTQIIHCLYTDPIETEFIYVGTSRGIRFSNDSGKHWKQFRGLLKGRAESVLSIAKNPLEPGGPLWLGTEEGLFTFDIITGTLKKPEGFPDAAVYAISFGVLKDAPAVVLTDRGIYNISTDLTSWQQVLTLTREEADAGVEASALNQFSIEEFLTAPNPSSLIYAMGPSRFYAKTPKGFYASPANGSEWERVNAPGASPSKINCLAHSPTTFYAGTDEGVFRWDEKTSRFERISEGLEAGKVEGLFYSENSDVLFAATERGLFKMPHPEIGVASAKAGETVANSEDILKQFAGEPSVADVQRAAMHYAECAPEKIQGWRRAASRKAWFPNLSLDTDFGKDQNVDLDRGGTGDPDKFIIGPEERKLDWSVGVNWDLGELIWNNDQTSIDTRSRLMVELRNDVLNEVTHLYFERRRLQIEMALAPMRDLPVQVEKEIKLQELTAGIDALTGGYMSAHLTN